MTTQTQYELVPTKEPQINLTATSVPDEQRIHFWPQRFGSIPQWITLEPRIFAGWTASVMNTAVVSGPFTHSVMAERLLPLMLTVTINGLCSTV